ncbi:MAG TPA: Bax inhibitor-1 family protein [Candidatus Azoamicus sp.]
MFFLYHNIIWFINSNRSFKNSWFGLIMVFIFTGFEGFYLGPIIKPLLSYTNWTRINKYVIATNRIIFYFINICIYNKKDFHFLNGFIFTGIITIISLTILSLLVKTTLIQAIISALIIIVSSSIILYETSNILNDRETNYISATICLYLQIYNLFLSIISLLNIFSSKD